VAKMEYNIVNIANRAVAHPHDLIYKPAFGPVFENVSKLH
jgi:hypothetical protein